MPEMVAMADRILVMHEFALIDEFVNDGRYETASNRIMDAIHSVTAGTVPPRRQVGSSIVPPA
jgi:ribose transport system ATP-binding protein